jgi:hypothetical protein
MPETVASYEERRELRAFQRNHHRLFLETGIAEVAKLNLDEDELEDIGEDSQTSLYMGGGKDRVLGPYFLTSVRFVPKSGHSIAVSPVAKFYTETKIVEAYPGFDDDDSQLMLDLALGMIRAKKAGILPHLKMDLISLSGREMSHLEHAIDYLDELAESGAQ